MGALVNKTDAAAPLRQIRFVHNPGQPPSKRRRINAACLTCRRRKTRCAGEKPLCSTCTKNGHRCLGYPEEIKRERGEEAKDEEEEEDYDEEVEEPLKREEKDVDKRSAKKSKTVPTGSPVSTKVPEPVKPKTTRPVKPVKPQPKPTEKRPTQMLPPSPSLCPPDAVGHASMSIDDLPQPQSPTIRRNFTQNNRVPYFRYFGPTAIVPGYKQMVVSVRDRRRSTGGSHSGTSPMSTPSNLRAGSSAAGSDVIVEDLPAYDVNDPAPVHPLILGLVKTFFTHVGCNYPFLKRHKFMRLVQEKRVEPILVDAVCALAARFSDSPMLGGGSEKSPRVDRGQIFAQRAKQATVDTFPCPSVGAVQACLLMAYEGFGSNQDSALWMYLGLAIRMAVDLGLQKRVGIRYQGEKDPWNQTMGRKLSDPDSPEDKRSEVSDTPSLEEQKELEQERLDTFWAVFVLDRVISSGTGRPVTFRDNDFDLAFPESKIDPATGWPPPFPIFLEIIHLYGRVCDVLNNIHGVGDLTQDKWALLTSMETQVTRMYKSWDPRLQFSVSNFKTYLSIGQGTTFILLHFWFHALFIILHQPTLITPFGDLRGETQLLSDSRELTMSSAKTICDILAFADLIDAKSFIGNPFTSQPIYIAACAFLMESSANASEVPSREGTPSVESSTGSASKAKLSASKHSRHSLLASAANQNYQRCYNSLQHLHIYWGGVKYILTALDQKSKGIWDCETYTSEEYESTKMQHVEPGSLGAQFARLEGRGSPKPGGPPIGWSLSGTGDSNNSSLTLMYQNGPQPPAPAPRQPSTPPGNMIYDPIRPNANAHEPGSMLPPTTYPQPHTSAVRHTSPRKPQPQRLASLSNSHQVTFDPNLPNDKDKIFSAPGYTPSPNGFDYTSPNSNAAGVTTVATTPGSSAYYPQGNPQGMYQQPWGNMDAITFDSQDIDIGALGLQQPDLMAGWWEYLPGDVLGLFEQQDMGQDGGNS